MGPGIPTADGRGPLGWKGAQLHPGAKDPCFPLSVEMTSETVTLSLTPLINKAVTMAMARPHLAPAVSCILR